MRGGYAVHLVTDETADDGRAGTAIDLDAALEALAVAHTGQLEQFAEVLHAAHPVTASGGLVIAVVTDLDEDLARQVASLRQPGGTGLAIVLDAHSFGSSRGLGAGESARELTSVPVLRSAGWSVVVPTAQDTIPAVWGSLRRNEPGGCAMSRTRLPETALAALATAVVSWPLTTLFTPVTWVRPTMVMIAVVAVAGLVGRRLTASSVGIIAIQLVAVVLAAGGLYGRGHLWHGLPTIDMVLAFNNLLVDARETVQSYSAPAPTNRGIILGIGLAIALTAILVDHLAVMRRSPPWRVCRC